MRNYKMTVEYDPKIKQFIVYGWNRVEGKWDQDGAPLFFSALDDVLLSLATTFAEATA